MKKISPKTTALGVLALCFLAGIAGGCILSLRGGAAADGAVKDYLSRFAGGMIGPPSVLRALADTFMYPALCFLFGLAVPGVLLIPLTISARGFFLSYMIASCMNAFGTWNGLMFSASLVGIPLIFSLPSLFLFGTQGLLGSYSLLRVAMRKSVSSYPAIGRRELALAGVSVCILAVAAIVEVYICPLLASAAAMRM